MRTNHRWVVAAALLAGAAGLWIAGRVARDQAPHLQLEEVASWTLPDSFELTGAFVSPADNTVAWAINQPYLLVEHGGVQRMVTSDSLVSPVGAALVQQDSLLEVVDSGRRSMLRLTLAGAFVSEKALDLPWKVDDAVRARSAWLLAGRDGGGNGRVIAVADSGRTTPLLTLPARQHEGTPLALQLSEAGDAVFATVLGDPRLVLRMSASQARSGRVLPRAEFGAPALPDDRAGAEDAALWISLGIHPLDRGFIRTFSDLRSDRRVLATYDRDGRLLRDSGIAVPMAVVATVPRRRVLLAARRTDRMELVKYRWSWVGVEPQPGESER
jgi:hypothetical protein